MRLLPEYTLDASLKAGETIVFWRDRASL